MNRAVFLDRDGVINRPGIREGREVAPTRLEDFQFLPGIHDLVKVLRREGFRLIVVTNQPDVVYGRSGVETVEGMHRLVRSELEVDAIYVCFHVDADACDCRKPKPGLLLRAAKEFDIDLARSFIIGDTWRDMGAGRAAGCTTVLLTGNSNNAAAGQADCIVRSHREAGELILAGSRQT